MAIPDDAFVHRLAARPNFLSSRKMNDQPMSSVTRPGWLSIGATLVVLLFAIGFARAFNYSFRANDDTVWWYLTGVELASASAVAPLNDAVRTYLAEQKDADVAFPRWQLRERYTKNYLLPSALIYVSSRAVERFVQAFRAPYGLFFTLSLALGLVLSALVAVSSLRWVIVTSRDLSIAFGTLVGVAAIALSGVVPQTAFNLTSGGNLATIDEVGIRSRIWPSKSLRFIRNIRFSGTRLATNFICVQWLFFCCAGARAGLPPMHSPSFSCLCTRAWPDLMLMLLVIVDALARPQVFDRKVIATVLVGIAVMFGRETLFSQLGLWQAVAVAIVLLLIAATLIAATKYYPRITLFESADKFALALLRQQLARVGIIGADLVSILAIWLITLPVALVAVRVAPPAAAYHFWGEIYLRVLMLWQPVFFIGVCVLLVRWLEARLFVDHRWLYGAVIAISALAVTPALIQAIAYYDAGLVRFSSTLLSYSQLLGKPLPQLDTQTREAVLYFAISAKQILRQTSFVRCWSGADRGTLAAGDRFRADCSPAIAVPVIDLHIREIRPASSMRELRRPCSTSKKQVSTGRK